MVSKDSNTDFLAVGRYLAKREILFAQISKQKVFYIKKHVIDHKHASYRQKMQVTYQKNASHRHKKVALV